MRKLVLAAFAVIALTSSSFAQDKGKKVTEAEIKASIEAINALKGDAAKLKSYCEMLSIGAKADEAIEKNDEKTAESLGKKAEEIANSLGDKFNNAMGIVAQVDPEAKTSEALFKAVDELDSSCAKK